MLGDIGLTLTDSVDPVIAGSQLTYTISVTNPGPDVSQNVVVTSTIPANTTLVSTSGCAEDPNGAPTCSLGTLAVGQTAMYTITVLVDSSFAGNLTQTATVSSDTLDPVQGNNSATEMTAVVQESDLSTTVIDTPDPVPAGTALAYTINVDNLGPSDASSVVLTITPPVGLLVSKMRQMSGWEG